MKSLRHVVKHARFSPLEVAIILPLMAFLYTLMEWLFILEKPSFMSGSPFINKLGVLLSSISLISLIFVIALVPVAMLYYVIRVKGVRAVLRFVMCLMPAILLAATVLLFVDNITYNAFKFGVVSTKNMARVLYLIGFILLTLGLVIPIYRSAHSLERSRRKMSASQKAWLPAILGGLVVLGAALPVLLNPQRGMAEFLPASDLTKKPNVLLITGDGINAVKLSLYGAEENTTPFLSELAKTSLVAENAYSNAQGTIGSTTSILTGKDPSDTRILASTDILKGKDAYEHLPGLLNANGYHTVQLNFSYYADAYRVNFQNAFDEANGEWPVTNQVQTWLSKKLPADHYYFMRETFSRLSDRVEHLFYVKKMTNPFLQVTESIEKFNDLEKIEYLISLLDESEEPLFVHLHWMGTHGPKYYTENRVFSAGEDAQNQEKYQDEFYLDSILDFDNAIEKVYKALEERDLVDNTLLFVGSDHTQRWTVGRIPFLIHFPNDEHAGRITANIQNMDIAPTVLDYMGIAQPEWMAGQTLLQPLDPDRLIFIAAIPDSSKDPETGKVTYPESKPPYYQFGKMTLIRCDHYYHLNFLKRKFTDAQVPGFIGECPDAALSRSEAFDLILSHLREYGFDTSTLETIEH